MPNEVDFYTPGEVAKMLGLAELTVLGLLTSGQLQGHQDERARWWIPPAAVDAARHSSGADNSVGPLYDETIPITPVTPTDGGVLPASEETTQLEAGAETPRTPSKENGGRTISESGWTGMTFKAESTLQEERDRLRQDWERERQERQEA
jgi:hypothetical protein